MGFLGRRQHRNGCKLSAVHPGLAGMAAVRSGQVLHIPAADTKQVKSRMNKITQKSEGFMGETVVALLLLPRWPAPVQEEG